MRLVPDTPVLCTHCTQPLAVLPLRCVNPDCPLSAFEPDPTYGSEGDYEKD